MHKGQIIKLLRIKKGFNQIDFAQKTGITPNYLSLVENGKRDPAIEYLKTAAEALEIPVSLLLFEKADTAKFKDKKSKALAKQIDEKLDEIKDMLFEQLLEA